MKSTPSFLSRHNFSLGLFAVALLAFALPDLGRKGGLLRADLTANVAIFLIFLMQGLSLSSKALAGGIVSWPVHLFTQAWVFLFSAFIAFGIAWSGEALWAGPADLWKGLLFVGILPTTISSAASFTSAARGDTAAAIFNTVLSNFAGVFLTPLWVLLLFSVADARLPPVSSIFGKLFLIIILPLLLGQLLRPVWWKRSALKPRLQGHFRTLSNTCILFIVFAAFCDSVHAKSWAGIPVSSLLVCALAVILFILITSISVWASSSWFRFSPAQRVAVFYCGSQKTLAAGVPMATAIFAQSADLPAFNIGLFLLPLLLLHPLQLILAGILVPYFESYVVKRSA